jgi:hypothetical protein
MTIVVTRPADVAVCTDLGEISLQNCLRKVSGESHMSYSTPEGTNCGVGAISAGSTY